MFSLELGDVDEDGDLDALSAYYGSQEVLLWRGRGDGAFDEALRYGVGRPATDLEWASTWRFQFWYRDSQGDGAAFNLSDALRTIFCP